MTKLHESGTVMVRGDSKIKTIESFVEEKPIELRMHGHDRGMQSVYCIGRLQIEYAPSWLQTFHQNPKALNKYKGSPPRRMLIPNASNNF